MSDSPPRYRARSFEMHEDYAQLMSGAHRKPATPVGAPCLVAHFGFWQPVDNREHGHPETNGIASSWNQKTDDYLRALYCLIEKDGFDSPNTDTGTIEKASFLFLFGHAIELGSSTLDLWTPKKLVDSNRFTAVDRYFHMRYQSVLFTFKWHRFHVLLRFEKHQEYLTLTAYIDLSIVGGGVSSSPPSTERCLTTDPIFQQTLEYFAYFCRDLDDYRESFALDTSPDFDDELWRKRFSPHHDRLYTEIWETFSNEILLNCDPLLRLGVSPSNRINDYSKHLGGVFADFRGLVIAPPHPVTARAQRDTARSEAPVADIEAFTGPDSRRQPSPASSLQMPGWRMPGRARKYWLAARMSPDHVRIRAQELWPFVTSEKLVPLRRKEFTVSSMLDGHALYISALGAQRSPYIDGSLPDHTPVYYLMYVNTFSQWQIGRLLDRIHNLGTVRIAAIQELPKLFEVNQNLRDLRVPSELTKIREQQNTISGWDDRFESGLNYRIERSRYYVKQFHDGLKQLRLERVEGYQPYDIFVLRRLASTFDFIDSLGIRIERYRNRLDVSAQIDTAESLASNALQLRKLQETGEGFLWFIFAPYYISGSIDHIISRPQPEILPNLPIGTAYIFIWVISGLIGLWRILGLERQRI